MNKDLSDKELLVMARRILQAARSRGMTGRIITVRGNPEQSEEARDFAWMRSLQRSGAMFEAEIDSFRAVPSVAAVLRGTKVDRVASTSAREAVDEVTTQRAITGMDLARTRQADVVIVVPGGNDPALAGRPALRVPQPDPNKVVIPYTTPLETALALSRHRYSLGIRPGSTAPRRKIIVGVVTDIEPDPANLPAWAEGLAAAIRASTYMPQDLENPEVARRILATGLEREALEAEAAEQRKASAASAEESRKKRAETLRTVIPATAPVGETIDPLKSDIENVIQYSQTLRESAEENRQRVYDALTAELAEMGYEFVLVPYTRDLFQNNQCTPGADVLVVMGGDFLINVVSRVRPRPNVISIPFDSSVGEPNMEGVQSIGLVVPVVPTPMWITNVERELVKNVKQWAAEQGTAAGIRALRREAGSDFASPMSGRVEEYRLANVATPKVVISTDANIGEMQPYTAHIDALQGLANARKSLTFYQQDREYVRYTQEIEDEKQRLNTINAMPPSPLRGLRIIGQYADGIRRHIEILVRALDVTKDAFRRAKNYNMAADIVRLRGQIQKEEADIAALRARLNALPPNIGERSPIGERLRALKALFPTLTPEGGYRGDDRTGIYRFEVFDLPKGLTPVLNVGAQVQEGQTLLQGEAATETFMVDSDVPSNALSPLPRDKKKVAPAFAVISVVYQQFPVSTAAIKGLKSAPIKVPSAKGQYERAYTLLYKQLAASEGELIPELAADQDLLEAAQTMACRMPKSGFDTPRFKKQYDAIIQSTAHQYVALKVKREFLEGVNAFLAPHYNRFIDNLHKVYRLYGEDPKVQMEREGVKSIAELRAYMNLLEAWAGKNWAADLEARVLSGIRMGEARDYAEQRAAKKILGKLADPKNPPPIDPARLAAETEKEQRKILQRRYMPDLIKDPVMYYTITFFGPDGKTMWEGSVPLMKVLPPEGVELIDYDTGRPERLLQIASEYPLSATRSSGVLRRSGYHPFLGYARGSAERFVAMQRYKDMEYTPADPTPRGMREAALRASMLERISGTAAELEVAAGTAQYVRGGDVRVEYGVGGGMRGAPLPFTRGGEDVAGSVEYGTYGITVAGGAPSDTSVTAYRQEGIPKTRFDRMIGRIVRTYMKDYEPRREGDLEASDWKVDEQRYLSEYTQMGVSPGTQSIYRSATSMNLAEEAAEARRIMETVEGRATLEGKSGLGILGEMKENPMRNLLNNPRYRQLMERTGRAFGKTLRRNAGESDDPFAFAADDSDAPTQAPQAARAEPPAAEEPAPSASASPRGGSRRRGAAPRGGSPFEGEAAPPPPPSSGGGGQGRGRDCADPNITAAEARACEAEYKALVEQAFQRAQRDFGNLFDNLSNVRASTADVESADVTYRGSLASLRDVRSKYFRIVELAFGKPRVEAILTAEAAGDLARATAPILRAPGQENEQYRSEMRGALARQMARQIKADGSPLYDVTKLLEKNGLNVILDEAQERAEKAAAGTYGPRPGEGEQVGKGAYRAPFAPPPGAAPALVMPSAEHMVSAARSQGAMTRYRPPSTASAYEKAEREAAGRSISMYDYQAPTNVVLKRSPGVEKSIVLWMSPLGDHIIRYIGPARSGQFHQLGSVQPDGTFVGETWVDVLIKALTHQTLFLQDEAAKGVAGKWEIWIGKSGWPALYRIHDSTTRTPFTVQAGLARMAAMDLNVDVANEPLLAGVTNEKYAKAVSLWAKPPDAGSGSPETWPGVREDVEAYQNALAKTFGTASIAPTAGLSILRGATREKYETERREEAAAEQAEASPAQFVFIPPNVYDAGANLIEEAGGTADAGQTLRNVLKASVAAAVTAGVPLRIFDSNLFGRNDALMQATLSIEPTNRLTLASTMRGGSVMSGKFPSPLLAALELASEEGGNLQIELFVPAGARSRALPDGQTYQKAIDAFMQNRNISDGVRVTLTEGGFVDWKTSLPTVIRGFNKVVLLNVPDDTQEGRATANLFGDINISKPVVDAVLNNIGHVSQVVLVTSESTRTQMFRSQMSNRLDAWVRGRLGQKSDVTAETPIQTINLGRVLQNTGFSADQVEVKGNTRAAVVEAIKRAVIEHAGLASWDDFIEQFISMQGNPRRNPFLRPNYGRRTRIDMASRYMRQVPWMWPDR